MHYTLSWKHFRDSSRMEPMVHVPYFGIAALFQYFGTQSVTIILFG